MYDYNKERSFVFTERGQVVFLSIRDKKDKLLNLAGVATMSHLISGQTGISWELMACVDRLVELGEIKEISQANCAGQHRVFVGS